MPVTVRQIDPNTVRLEIEIPAETLEAAFERELRRQRARLQVRGYRPGKAPLSVVRGYFGDRVLAEVAVDLMRESLVRAVEEHDVRAVGTPKLEHEAHKLGQPLRFSATFEVHERPREIDLAGLKVVRRIPLVDEADVKEELELLRAANARMEPIEPPRPARKGDLARIDYEIRRHDRPQDKPIRHEGLEVEVGSDDILEEISSALEGMSVGEEKAVTVALVGQEAGTTATAQIKLVDLCVRRLPALDDDFARELGEPDLATLCTKIRNRLQAELCLMSELALEDALLEQVVERANPALPSQWLEEKFRERLAEVERALGGGRKLDPDQQAALREKLRRELRRAIVVSWLADLRNLRATPEQVDKRIQQIAEMLGRPLAAVKAEFAKKGTAELESELTHANVLAALKAAATIEEEVVRLEPRRSKHSENTQVRMHQQAGEDREDTDQAVSIPRGEPPPNTPE